MSVFSHSRRSVIALVIVGPLSMIVASLGITSAGATSVRHAPTSKAAIASVTVAPRTSQFCTFAANASKTNTAAAATATPTSLLAAFNKLKSEEPAILAASPSQIKGDFQVLFNYFNKFYGELATVKYQFLKLPHSYLATLEASLKPVEAASKAITTYLTKTCGLKV
jgi:hypothetical protein